MPLFFQEELYSTIADHLHMTVTGGYVIPENATDEQRKLAEERIQGTLELLNGKVERKAELIKSKSIAGGIAKASRDYDLVVIGAAKEPFFRRILFGEIPERVARYSPTSVLVVKKYEGAVKSLFKRIFG